MDIETLKISNYILSTFVALHIGAELYHYISEWIKNRRDKKMLEHIDEHLDNMECQCGGNCKDKKGD